MDQYDSSAVEDRKGLWDWNLVSKRIHFSPSWISLVGCEDHEVGNTAKEWMGRVHPDDLDQVRREIENAQSPGAGDFEGRHRLRHKDGGYRWMQWRGVAVRNAAGKAIRLTGSHSDVTLETVTDPLTGLPNRLLLVDRLTRAIERANRYPGFHFAVLLLDLGSPAGSAEAAVADSLLTAVARRVETCLRIGDTTASLRHNDLVARLGDQFAILLEGLKDVSHAKVVADRILVEILATFMVGGREMRLPASLGIAVSATGYQRPDEVLRDAETALHRARVLGGSHCELFDTAILKAEQAELQLEGELKGALERREFQLCYQPIVSLSSNQIVGFEALVRWQHPMLGMIAPLDFVPLAEKTGFIVPLGQWILGEACLRLREWQESLPHLAALWMSVNLSSVQLRNSTLIEQVGEALREASLDGRSLVLELTESVAMENPTSVKTLLMQLRAMGVRISIDDFGTGYSSLAYLRQLPLDALKIDQSFVRGMETRKDASDIIGTLTTLAGQLGLHVVAEGVENEEQLVLLRSLRCDSVQGFFFAQPLDVEKATELLTTGFAQRPESFGDQEPALPSGPDVPMFELSVGGGLSQIGRRPAIAAAAVLALITAVVFVTGFSSGPPQTSGAPAPKALPPAVAVSGAREDSLAKTPTQPSKVTAPSGTKAVEAPGLPTAAVSLKTGESAAAELTHVVHLHRVGSCQGQLVVSRDGVAFVPDEKSSKDGFALRYKDFLPTLVDTTLTLKSNNRTYRFKAASEDGKVDSGVQLHDLIESIERFR